VSTRKIAFVAPDAYKHFDDRDKGWTKVIMHPKAA
jgi:hypothetical protein